MKPLPPSKDGYSTMIKSKVCIHCKKRFYFTNWIKKIAINHNTELNVNMVKSWWDCKLKCDECSKFGRGSHQRFHVPARYNEGDTRIISLRSLSKKQYQDIVSSVIEKINFEVKAEEDAVVVDTTDGISPKDKSLGILPNEL